MPLPSNKIAFLVRVTVRQECGKVDREALKKDALAALRYRVEKLDCGQFFTGSDVGNKYDEATFESVDYQEDL